MIAVTWLWLRNLPIYSALSIFFRGGVDEVMVGPHSERQLRKLPFPGYLLPRTEPPSHRLNPWLGTKLTPTPNNILAVHYASHLHHCISATASTTAMASEKASLGLDAHLQAPIPRHRHVAGRCPGRFVRGALLALGGLAIFHTCFRNGPAPDIPTPSEPNTGNSRNLCLTPECIHASSEILYNLAPNYKEIDPCTNFEDLVCRGWTEKHDLRPDQGDAFTGTFMAERSQTLLRHILEAPYPKTSNVRAPANYQVSWLVC